MSLLIHLQLKMHNGETIDYATAFTVGAFGIFNQKQGSDGHWNVTHIATGVAVEKGCCCVMKAIAVAEELTPLIDWDTTDTAEIERRGNAVKIRETLNKLRTSPCPSK